MIGEACDMSQCVVGGLHMLGTHREYTSHFRQKVVHKGLQDIHYTAMP